MLYRELGKTGEKLSILGFGAMRLPTIDGDDSKIDEETAIKMIRYAIDNGVNYLDTAYPYHRGNSELLCAKAMEDGYRDKVKIATKLPSWDIKEFSDMERILDEQLAKLKVDTIDFYLLHAMGKTYWSKYKKLDYKAFLDKAKKDGKIKYAGFSHHDDVRLFKEVIDDYDWDFCQIQLNYMDENYQAGLVGMRYAASKGIGVIVMEPLRGGMLARPDIPDELKSILDSSEIKRSSAEWALRYLWNYPEVGVVLSGMSNMDQVIENVNSALEGVPDSLTVKDRGIIRSVKSFYKEKTLVNCTSCGYCMPCPSGVNIPENFWAYNHESQTGDLGKAIYWITGFLNEQQRASNCSECGECEELCPQNIPIREHLKKVAEKYEREAN